MSKLLVTTLAGFISMSALGCRSDPPPPRVSVPAAGQPEYRAATERDPRPLNPTYAPDTSIPRGYDDVPLVNQRTPEERAFIDAYTAVGRPRILVFVNRTLEGNTMPVNPDDPVASVRHTRRSTTGVTVDRSTRETTEDAYSDRERRTEDRYQSNGPGEYSESTELYLRPGQYDEVAAKQLDYEAVENVLTDWLSASGQTTIISPLMARQRLTDQEVKDLQDGRPQVLGELVEKLQADVLVHVQAHPTRQTRQGLEVRVIAEALNTRGGQSIGRAVVDVPPPLEKTQINKYTRFMARKLMDGMTASWASAPAERSTLGNATTQPQ